MSQKIQKSNSFVQKKTPPQVKSLGGAKAYSITLILVDVYNCIKVGLYRGTD